jgi:SEC-C motif-containing protein
MLLMRSRYSAFALAEDDYLLETWHEDFRPARLELDARIRWLGLEIVSAEQEGTSAQVEFETSLMAAGEVSSMRERSQFVHMQGRWLYTTGESGEPRVKPWRPGRNQACPCGSGLKFKRCCAMA